MNLYFFVWWEMVGFKVGIFNTFKMGGHQKDDLEYVVAHCNKKLKLKTNTVVDRYTFFNHRQKGDESIHSFVTSLKTQEQGSAYNWLLWWICEKEVAYGGWFETGQKENYRVHGEYYW